jgi:hypothetical protein
MRIKILLILFLFFYSNANAQVTVITVYPADRAFKFVWSGTNGVLKSKDGQTTLRCEFEQGYNGVDDEALPYVGSSFLCTNNMRIMLKQTKGTNNSALLLLNVQGKLLSNVIVNVEKNNY